MASFLACLMHVYNTCAKEGCRGTASAPLPLYYDLRTCPHIHVRHHRCCITISGHALASRYGTMVTVFWSPVMYSCMLPAVAIFWSIGMFSPMLSQRLPYLWFSYTSPRWPPLFLSAQAKMAHPTFQSSEISRVSQSSVHGDKQSSSSATSSAVSSLPRSEHRTCCIQVDIWVQIQLHLDQYVPLVTNPYFCILRF
jgi:hypothetical protein